MKRIVLSVLIGSFLILGFVYVFVAPVVLDLGSGGCKPSVIVGDFDISEQNQSQGDRNRVVYFGGDDMQANKTFVVINNQSQLWSERHSPRSDGTITAGDNVSVELSRGDALRIEYQRPPPSGTLNPFEEPCYTERNQTVYSATYTPETPTRGS